MFYSLVQEIMNIQCQQQYKFNNNAYVSCLKVSQTSNLRLNIQPEYNGTEASNYSIFQYAKQLDNTEFVKNFIMFGSIQTNKIDDCQFILYASNVTQFYGLSQSIAAFNTTMINTILSFTLPNNATNTFSLAQHIYSNLTMYNCKDNSSFKSDISSMSQDIFANVNITKCQFSQIYESISQSALFTLTAKSSSSLYVNNCTLKVLVTSGDENAYGLVRTVESGAQVDVDNLRGYVSGAYISLLQNGSEDITFDQYYIMISVYPGYSTIIQDTANYNNTQISLGNTQVVASGEDIQLFSQRPIYYGLHIIESMFRASGETCSLLTKDITDNVRIGNLYYELDFTSNTTKFAGVSLTVSQNITLDNCTYEGSINGTGSVFLLFETATQPIVINNLTTNIELSFADDSYGLIKTVQNGITINGYSCNMSMYITGDTEVSSSLMFDTVSGTTSLSGVTGYYSGYLTGQICSGSTCSANNSVVDLQPREVSIYNQTYMYYSGEYIYQVSSSYVGKLNGTIITFQTSNQSMYESTLIVKTLGDCRLTQNVNLTASFYNSYSYSYYTIENRIGIISGWANKTDYKVTNVTVNITFTSSYMQNGTGAIGSLFGILNTSATITNVTDYSNLQGGNGDLGGLIGQLTAGTVTMTNVTSRGQYRTGGDLGCFIGSISTGATTNLINGVIDQAYMYSMGVNVGPVYGLNNGSFTNMQIEGDIDLAQRSMFTACPVGSDKCPEKPSYYELNVSSYACDTSYTDGYQFCYALNPIIDYNNTEITLIMSSMSSVTQNRSLFNSRPTYQNIYLIVNNTPSYSYSTDYAGFAYLQAVIGNTTTNISNVYIEGPMHGTIYAYCGALAIDVFSNVAISNVTANMSRIYFYYPSAFIYQCDAQQLTIDNIKLNFTSGSSRPVAGLITTVNTGTTLTVTNGYINGTQNSTSSVSISLLFNETYSTASYTIDSVNFTLNRESTSSYYSCIINATARGQSASFTNCTANVTEYYTGTLAVFFVYNQISGVTSYINTNVTGYLKSTSTSMTSSYMSGGLEPNVTYGTGRVVTNVTIEGLEIIANKYIGGLFGYASGSRQINVTGTTINASITLNGQTYSTVYLGGFVGEIYTSSVQFSISSSQFINQARNDEVGCLVSESSSYEPTVDNESSTCPEVQLIITVDTAPEYNSYYYSGKGYTNGAHGCFWEDFDGSTNLNQSTFNFTFPTADSSCGDVSGGSILSIFSPTFTPSTVNSITTIGTIKAQSYWHVGIVLQMTVDQYSNTTFTNVNLNHTNQEVPSADYQFNMYGMIYKIDTTYNVSFIDCVNQVYHNHTGDSYLSYASGFTHIGSSYFTLQGCVSNFTVEDYYSYDPDTQQYAVGYSLSSCDDNDLITDKTLGRC